MYTGSQVNIYTYVCVCVYVYARMRLCWSLVCFGDLDMPLESGEGLGTELAPLLDLRHICLLRGSSSS